jgi:hypothetical protein
MFLPLCSLFLSSPLPCHRLSDSLCARHARAQFNCVEGFFCPAGKMYDPIGLCVEERECSVVAGELPPGIALGRCEETRDVADGLPIAGETD